MWDKLFRDKTFLKKKVLHILLQLNKCLRSNKFLRDKTLHS